MLLFKKCIIMPHKGTTMFTIIINYNMKLIL